MRVSIIIPVYRNEASLPMLIEKLNALTDKADNYSFEFIFVDDGSDDNSFNLLSSFKNNNAIPKGSFEVVKLTRNFGQLPALYAGLAQSSGDLKCFLSADLQDDPMIILELAKNITPDYQLVLAERESRPETGFSAMTSKLFYRYLRSFVIKNYPKNGYDYCMFTNDVAQELLKYESKNAHIFVVLIWLGFPFKKITYKRVEREGGKSQWTFLKRLTLFIDVAIGFSYTPIRAITVFGFIFSLLSFIFASVIIFLTISNGNPVQGWPSIMVFISFSTGIIMMTLGVLGEYLWRTLDSSRKRQLFIVEKIL
jgi:dolichol-phosphate mannosyltransferase